MQEQVPGKNETDPYEGLRQLRGKVILTIDVDELRKDTPTPVIRNSLSRIGINSADA